MIKRYEVSGMMEWHPVFNIGRTRMRVSFTGGHLCGGGTTPAAYETADPVVQMVIENSAAFRSKRIRLASSRLAPCENSTAVATATPLTHHATIALEASHSAATPKREQEKELTTMEFENLEEVSDYLHFKRQIPTSRLIDLASCKHEALKIGIEIKLKGKQNAISNA